MSIPETPHTPTNYAVVQAMLRYGGSFAGAIGDAFSHADEKNFARLKAALPDLWDDYVDLARRAYANGKGPK